MFCERIDKYGGMSREIERRLKHQGFAFQYIPEAKGVQLHKSTGWDKKAGDESAATVLFNRHSLKNDKTSIIIPTCNRYSVAVRNVENLQTQTWPDIEIIVCDDSDRDEFNKNSKNFRKEILAFPNVSYHYVARFDVDGNKDYGLARARNFGTIAANGEFLVFLDDRITAGNKHMVHMFVKQLKDNKAKLWVFGDKGAQKQSFVENCSAVRRRHLIDAGMFCERIDKYGGMSREIERRLKHQGFKFLYVPDAVGVQLHKSTGWDKKPAQISEMKKLIGKMFDQ
jgi:GT2 family glycosyltransferase